MATTITTSTSTESINNLVSVNSILYIRPIELTVTVNGCRPNTPMNVFFDSVNVNHFSVPLSAATRMTDANGYIRLKITIPGGTFNTGTRSIVVTDADSLEQAYINGSTFGSASVNFTSSGIQDIFQRTSTTTVQQTITEDKYLPPPPPPPPPPRPNDDPLAQSFFTYGKSGGVFLTSIDLFFNSKDNNVPVSVEIRNMVNGYPSIDPVTNADYIAYKNPADVLISNDATLATKFTFKYPIYLQQDKDYCFVVRTNTNRYSLFTSKLGESALETGKTIFDQPYTGTLFKSSNNSTWNAEQFEDIKFKLYVANFDTNSTGVLNIAAQASAFAVPSVNFSTTASSNVIRYYQPQKHGLEVNSKLYITSDANAVFNGIPAAYLSGNRTVTNVVDDYTVEYLATNSSGGAANASSSGPIITGQQVKRILVVEGGSGYTVAPTVQFTSLSGVNAAATAVVHNGAVVAIKITNPGSGYLTPPEVTLINGDGVGATARALTDGMFSVTTNKPVNFLIPNIPTKSVTDTNISATVSTTQLNYTGGNLSTYIPGGVVDMNVKGKTALPINSMVASAQNETARMSGNSSLLAQYTMVSSNANVSPMIDLRNNPSITAYSNRINNDSTNEDTPDTGAAQARYLTKKTGLSTPSTGILVTSQIYSEQNSSVEWYVRTSLSASGVDHSALNWQALACDVTVNKSGKPNQYFDYEFYLYDVPTFDTYDLKCVLKSADPSKAPVVKNYRVIVTA